MLPKRKKRVHWTMNLLILKNVVIESKTEEIYF